MAYKLTAADRRALAQMRARDKERTSSGYRAVNYTAPKSQASGNTGSASSKKSKADLGTTILHTAGDLTADVIFGAGKGIEGIIDFGASIVGGIGGLFSDDFQKNIRSWIETDWVGKVADPVDEYFEHSATNGSKFGQIIEGVASGVGQMLPAVAVTVVSGGLGAPTAVAQGLSLATLGVSAAGTGAEEAFADGAGYGQGMLYGIASGGVEVATERLLPGVGDEVFGKALLKGFGKVGGEVAEQGAKRVIKQTAANMLNEGVEEMVSEATNPLRKTIYKGKDALSEYGEGEFWAGVGEAGVTGALTSAAYGATVGNVYNKAKGLNGDIYASLEKIEELEKKKSKMQGKRILTPEAEAQIDKSIDANYKQVEAVLSNADAKTKAKYMKNYSQKLGTLFNEKGSYIGRSGDTMGLDGQYYSVSGRGHEAEIKAVLDSEGVTAYHGELTEQEKSNLSEVYQAHEKLNELGYAGKHVVIVDSMSDSNAFIGKNVIAIGKDMLTNGEHIKKLIHETTHFTEGSKEWHSVAKFVFGKDTKNIRTALKAELDAVLNSGYGVTEADLDAVIAHIESGYETKLTEKQGLLIEEVVATKMENMFGDMQSVEKLCRENQSLAKQIWERIKVLLEVFGKSHSEREEIKKLRETERLFRAALETGGQDYIRGEMEEASGEADGETVQFSKKVTANGIKFVLIEQESIEALMACEGKTVQAKVRNYMKRYRGTVLPLGSTDKAYMRREAEGEYTNPAKVVSEDTYNDKLKAASELENLLASAEFSGHENDNGRHPDATRGWNYYAINYVVPIEDNKFRAYTGEIQIKLIDRGDCFYDITKIEDITNGTAGQALIKAAGSVSTSSTISISQKSEKSTPETKKSRKVQHSYKGEHAKDIEKNRKDLFTASFMDMKGKDSEEIRKHTGWFRGLDGKWRFEIDDSRMRYLNPELRNGETTLGELIEHDELFEAYPKLKDYKVKLVPGEKSTFFRRAKTIHYSEELFENGDFAPAKEGRKSGKALVIHEIQHAIQELEGFKNGAAIASIREELEKKYKEEHAEAKAKTKKLIQKIYKDHGELAAEEAIYYVELQREYYGKKASKEVIADINESAEQLNLLGLDVSVSSAVQEEFDILNKLATVEEEATQKYYDTTGEIEAYDVGERVDLDAETRRAVRPDIDRNPDDVKFADPTKWKKMHGEDGEDENSGNSNKYSYETLTQKGPLHIILLGDQIPTKTNGKMDRGEIIKKGRQNARDYDNPNNTDKDTYVWVPDISLNVRIHRDGLEHGLDRKGEDTAIATMNIGDLLTNSIAVNELNARTTDKKETEMSYVLLACGRNQSDSFIVRIVVDKNKNTISEISSYGLYAIRAKKDGVLFLPKGNEGERTSVLGPYLNSTISIADLFESVKGIDIVNEIFSKDVASQLGVNRTIGKLSKDIKYSRKSSDNSGGERKVLLPVLNKERFKIYTQENAEKIVSSITHNILNFNDGTQGVIKDKGELVDIIWKRLNGAGEGNRGAVALDLAELIIQRTAVKTIIEDPANAERIEVVSAIKPYLHSLNLSDIKGEIEHRFGKKAAKGIMLVWGAQKGSRGITADMMGQELAEYGINIDAMTEADIFFEVYDMYKEASEALKKKANVMLDTVIPEEERKQLKQDIAKEILDGFHILGKKSTLTKMMEVEMANSRLWKEQYYDQKHRAKAINHLFETVDRVRNIVDMKKADEEIAEEVETLVKLLKKIKTNRGNISKNVREIMKAYAAYAGDSKIKLYDLITDKLDGEINPFAEQIEAIAHGNGDLSTREIEALDSILRNFIHNANNYKRVFLEGKVQEAKDVIEQGLSETAEALAVKNDGVFGFGNRVKESMQSPVWRFERLGCYRKDTVIMKLWRELQSGFSRQAAFEMRAAEHFRQFFEKHKKTVNKWREATYELDGAKVSRGQMIGLYLTSLREQGRGHLFGESDNGVARFTDERVSKKRGAHFAELEGKDLRVTQSDIVEFEKTLTETEREFIALAQTFFNEISKNAKVETDEALYGVTNVVDANYYPLRVADDQIYKRLGDGTFRFADLFNLYSPSFNKATVDHANNKLVIENVIDVINRHSKQMANYYGFARAVKTFNRVYNMKLDKNGPSMRDAIHKVDMRFEEYVGRLIQDIQGNRVYKSGAQRVLSKLRGWGAKAALGANLKVLVSQFISMPASAAVGFKYHNIAKGFTLAVSHKTNFEKMFEYCPMLYDRFRNGNNIDVGLLKEGRGILDNLDWLTDFTTAPIGKIDARVCCAIWNAALEQTKGSYEAYSDAHYKAAAELTEQALIKTQANYAPLYRSDILRNQDSFMQLATMFMGEPLQQFSLLSSSIEKMYVTRHLMKNAPLEKRAEYEQIFKQGKKEAAQALTAVFIDTLILTAIAQFFKWFKGKEDEDKVEGIIGDFVENYVGMFPFVKDAYGYIMNGYDITNMAYTGFTNIADGITSISEMIDLFASGEAYDETKLKQKTRKVLLGISQTFGIPLRNLETYLKGFVDKISPEAVYRYESKFYGASVSQYTKDLTKAIEDGHDELADTILDIMLDESGTDITLRREMRTLITNGYKVIPKSVGEKVTYDGEEIVLTKKQKARFKELYAVGNESAAELVKLHLYKKADEKARAKALRFIYDTYYNLALQEALGLDLEGKNVLFAEAMDIEQLAIIVGIAQTIEADVDRKGNVISGSRKAKLEKYVQSLPLKAVQKYMIMGYLGYKNKNGEAQVKAYINRLSLTKDEKAQLLEYSGYAA